VFYFFFANPHFLMKNSELGLPAGAVLATARYGMLPNDL
jgi:hypothetical protein